MGFINGAPLQDLYKIREVVFHNSFLQEIDSLDAAEYEKVAYSAFCAITYPPIGEKNACKLSIDWHPESKMRKNGDVFLYRIDVVSPNSRASGKKRLLKAVNGNKIALLAFENDHDFAKEVLKNRSCDFSKNKKIM